MCTVSAMNILDSKRVYGQNEIESVIQLAVTLSIPIIEIVTGDTSSNQYGEHCHASASAYNSEEVTELHILTSTV